MAYDNDALFVNSVNSTGETNAFTCTGSELTLTVFVALFGVASNGSSSAPTYNGVSMTSAATPVEYNYQLNRYFNLEVYTLDDPATGSNNIVTAYSGTATANAIWAYSETSASNGVGSSSGSSTGNTNNPAATFTTDAATGKILALFMCLGADFDPFTPDGSETERQDTDTGGGSTTTDFAVHCMELAATGGSDTVSSTGSTSDHWLTLAIELNAAAAASGRIMSSLAAGGGLAHLGGIAGRGGGLAG